MGWFAQRFELARGGDAANLRPMEGLRGFAVFLVFLVHFATLVEPWVEKGGGLAATLGGIHSIGNAGVDLFFVLSGYLIYGTLITQAQRFWPYFQRRLRRIYPAFLAVFAIYVALSYLQPAEQRKIPVDGGEAAWYLVQNLLLLPGLFPTEPLIAVAWSLSYELFYYLVMPLLVLLLGLRSRSAGWRWRFFWGLTVAGFVAAALWGGHVRLTMFLAGVLLFEWLRSGREPVPDDRIVPLLAMGSLAAMMLPMPTPLGQAIRSVILFSGFFVLCWSCFAKPQGPIGRAFSGWPLRWLGNMSYSYYLLHGLALKVFFMAVEPLRERSDPLAALLVVPAFAATLFFSALLFLAVERPFSLAPRRRPAAPSTIREGNAVS